MKYSILAAAALALAVSCSYQTVEFSSDPGLATLNIIDRNGFSETISSKDRLNEYRNVDFFSAQPYQKVLQIYSKDENGDVKAYITSYHANGLLKQYLEVVNNRAYGVYQEWHENGALHISSFVIGGEADINTSAEKTWLFDGKGKVFDEKGNLQAEFSYDKGFLEGDSVYFHPNGSIWKKIPYKKNQIHGTFEIYLETGALLQTAEYSKGQRHGKTLRYWPGGCIASDETYEKGALLSGSYFDLGQDKISSVVDGNGLRAVFGKTSVSELQEYRDGVQDGMVKQLDPSGGLIGFYHIKNGLKHGEEVEFFEKRGALKQKPKLSITWFEGKIHGPVKTWYETGVQESQREMSNNLKNGLASAWYLDGSVMLIEEYDHDVLVSGRYFQKGESSPVSEVVKKNGVATLFDASGNFIRKATYINGKPILD